MCSIAGIVTFEGGADVTLLKKMNQVQKHRGPDGEGVWISDNKEVALGHTRLAIVDLNSSGSQPMLYGKNRYAITYNGELYNYQEIKSILISKGHSFVSTSDTEVILAAFAQWGENSINYFNGMFAFAIWDEYEKKLFCARDRMGIKPFYYYHDNNCFVFASEIKGIQAAGIPLTVNNKMLYNFILNGFHFNAFDLSETFYNNIYKLEASHFAWFDFKNKFRKTKYWEIPTNPIVKDSTPNKLIETYKELLFDSIKIRSNTNIPIAACLSGGLDSSSIVCIGNKLNLDNRFQTFSARFDSYEFDEGNYIKEIINREKNLHHDLFITQKDMEDCIESAFNSHDTPFVGTSYLSEFLIMRHVKEKGLKIVIDGQGADETIGGYKVYYETILRQTIAKTPYNFPSALLKLKSYSSKDLNINWKFYFSTFAPWAYKKIKGIHKQNIASNIFNTDFKIQNNSNYDIELIYHNLYKHMHRNSFSGDLEHMLGCNDISSMASGVESRLPFLDFRLIEFLFSIPENFKIRNFETKFIHREAMKGIIPEPIRTRKDKNGYSSPEKEFLEGEFMKQKLSESIINLKDSNIVKENIPLKSLRHVDSYKWRLIMASELINKTRSV